MQRSPSLIARVELVARAARERPQRRGPLRRRGRSGRRTATGPKPTVIVSRDGPRPIASPVSSGGSDGVVVLGAGGLARGHPRGGDRPLLQQRPQVGDVVARHVEGGEVEAVLGRRRDPGLVLAVERDHSRRVGDGLGLADARTRRPPPVPIRRPRRRPISAPARDPRRRGSAARRSLRDDLAAHLRERLGERVDRLAELLALAARSASS